MIQIPLAQAVQNGQQLRISGEVISLIALTLLLVPIFIWSIRYARSYQGMVQKVLDKNDEQMKYLARSCDHMDAAEGHMAAVEKKLDDVIDQLKRRPLS